jgi:hypothetical protein
MMQYRTVAAEDLGIRDATRPWYQGKGVDAVGLALMVGAVLALAGLILLVSI